MKHRILPKRAVVVLSSAQIVVVHHGHALLEAPLDLGTSDALAKYLGQLSQWRIRRITVLLAPDLCEIRFLKLPAMSRLTAVKAVARDVARYFLIGGQGVVVDAVRQQHSDITLAVAAPSDVIEAVESAARLAKLSITRIASCYEAWARKQDNRAEGWLRVDTGKTHEVMQIRMAEIVDVRRFPHGRADLLEQLLKESGSTFPAIPNESERDCLVAAGTHGDRVRSDLMSHEGRRRARIVAKRAVSVQWAAVIALLISALGVEAWGLKRELNRVVVLRSQLRAQADSAAREFAATQELARSAAKLTSLSADKTHFSSLLLAIVNHLPEDAHLTRIEADGDTIKLGVRAARAVTALEGMKQHEIFAALQLAGGIQRHQASDSTAEETFDLTASIRRSPRDK